MLAPSAFTRDELIREGFDPDGVVLAPLGVNRPVPRDPDEIDATVARVGRARAVRAHRRHRRAPQGPADDRRARCSGCATRRPDLELVVVGPPGWGEVAGLDRPGVRVLGPQPWRVVDALYRRAACCCIASRYEGFGLPALEALARGAPARRRRRLRARRGRRRRRPAVPARRRRRAHRRRRTRPRRRRAARRNSQRRGRRRAEPLTWEASAAAHVDAFRQAVGSASRQRA